MIAALLAGGIVYLTAIFVAMLLFGIMWFVIIIRAAISKTLGTKKKVAWILAMLLFPFSAIFYALTEKSKWWKAYAIINIALIVPLVALAIFAPQVESSKKAPQVNHTQNLPPNNQPAPAPSQEAAQINQLQERLNQLAESSKGDISSLYYVRASMRLRGLNSELADKKITMGQLMPHLDTLEFFLNDNVITKDELDTWFAGLEATGLLKKDPPESTAKAL